MAKRIVFGIIGVVVVAILAFLAVAWRTAIAPIQPPSAGSFSQAEIDHGRVLAGIGDCAVCHTSDAARPYAGGLPLPTQFGTIYTANITPDPDTGIGRWSEKAFVRAMREGVSRDGSYLLPAFPYNHFTKVNDADLKALYAYLMTRQAVHYQPPANTLRFPYNQRLLQAGWQMLFFDDSPFKPQPGRSAQWNRGAYLAQGLGHCAACHTPRNAMGAEAQDQSYDGAVIDQWYAPALNAGNRSPVPWTQKELYQYLRMGGSPLHGVAIGSMAPVIHEGLSQASDADIQALATYFSSLNPAAAGADAQASAKAAISAAHTRMDADMSHGAQIFAAACAGCHYNNPDHPVAQRPDMSLNSAVNAPEPDNLIRATLNGVSLKEGLPGVLMPGFGKALSDADIASLVAFLRRTQTSRPAWTDLPARVHSLRQDANAATSASVARSDME